MSIALNLISNRLDSPEARNAILSALPLVDAFVLVDTRTQPGPIPDFDAQSKSIRYKHRPWDNSFSNARNAALEATTEDYALILDTDETLVLPSMYLLETRLGIRPRQYWPNEVFGIVVDSGEGRYALDARIVPKHARYTHRGHNRLTLSPDGEPAKAVFPIPHARIRHTGYEHADPKRRRQTRDLVWQDWLDGLCDSLTAAYLAREHNLLGERAEAIAWARQALTMAQHETSAWKSVTVPIAQGILNAN